MDRIFCLSQDSMKQIIPMGFQTGEVRVHPEPVVVAGDIHVGTAELSDLASAGACYFLWLTLIS